MGETQAKYHHLVQQIDMLAWKYGNGTRKWNFLMPLFLSFYGGNHLQNK